MLLGTGVVLATGRFEAVFLAFEADMPMSTRWLLAYRLAWFVPPALTGALAVAVSGHQSFPRFEQAKIGLALLAIALFELAALVFAFLSLYLPILRLGQVG